MRTLLLALLTAVLALSPRTSLAQVSPLLANDTELEDCLPRPIPGTVAYETGRQSIETNAQVYGAEALVHESLNQDSNFALRLNNVYNVARVPAVAHCGTAQRFGTVGLDLFSSASGVAFPIKLPGWTPRLYYAGSVTGSVIHFPDGSFGNSRYYTSWGYAGFGYLSSFLAPLAPLLSRDDGLQTMAGDFIAGASMDAPVFPDMASLNVGYVYSSGLYLNASSRKFKLFASTLFTKDFSLLSLARAGLRETAVLPDGAGKTSLSARNMVLQAPGALATRDSGGFKGLLAPKDGGQDLSTIHLSQHRIGDYVTLSAALAVRPRVFLHEGTIAFEVPAAAAFGASELPDDLSFVSGTIGVSEMPALPWYANEGGRQLTFSVSFMEIIHVRRNAAQTLAIFPYAQGATEFSIFFDLARFQERHSDDGGDG